jgi:hypothetical protein
MKPTSIIKNASRAALQWRLLLIWLGAMLLPMLLMALPLWVLLSADLDRSVHAAALAQQLDMVAVADLMSDLRRNGSAVHGGGIAALAFALLFSPFLTGVAVTAARAQETARLRELFAGGLAEYPRMFRMLLWGLLLLGALGAMGDQLIELAGKHAEKAILASDERPYKLAVIALLVLLFVLVNATLDAGRADLAIDRRRTSAVKAWWRGAKLLWQRPGAVLGIYAMLTMAGLLAAAVLGVARLNIAGSNAGLLIAAFLLTQLIALVLAWMRAARLFALMTVSATNKAMQHSQIVH